MSQLLSKSPHSDTGKGRLSGISWKLQTEDISRETEWTISEDRHFAILHLGGKFTSFETKMKGCVPVSEMPMVGEMWLVPAGIDYHTTATGGEITYAEFEIDQPVINASLEIAGGYKDVMPQVGHFDKFFFENLSYLISLDQTKNDLDEMLAETLAFSLALHLLKNYSPHESIRPQKRTAMSLNQKQRTVIVQFINDSLSEKISLSRIADMVGLSVHDLLLRFRQSFNTTPAQYIITKRLRRARWLLTTTKRDITTISYETGFANHSHLTTKFVEHYGITPSTFRRSL